MLLLKVLNKCVLNRFVVLGMCVGDLLECIAARLSLRCIRIAVLPLRLTVHDRVGKSNKLFFKFDRDITWSRGQIAVAHLVTLS